MRKFLLSPMILTFPTDILTFQTNFPRSEYCVMGLEFRGQKVCFFHLYRVGPHKQTSYTEMTGQLNPR